MPESEILAGGVANAGAVVRVGDEVLRPAGAHTAAIHALLTHVRRAGFEGVPEPLGFAGDGRERLRFIAGDVPLPPFPAWSKSDEALASTARLLRRFHDATAGFHEPADAAWNLDRADPSGGEVICHNDVCPENVVYRGGVAVALLDFDFAAPGRRVFDLASLAIMCIPLDSPADAARTGRDDLDPFRRLRLVADAYGLPSNRNDLVAAIAERFADLGTSVRRRAENGDVAFKAMWVEIGGQERYVRRRDWFEENRARFVTSLDSTRPSP